MKEKLELVIFDMDGLMIDSESICIRAWEKTIENFGLTIKKEFFKDMIGSDANALRKKLDNILEKKFDFMEILQNQRKMASEIVNKEGIKRKKGILELLDYLDKNNIKKAVATSSFREKTERYLKITDLNGRFDYIICGDEVKKPKPAPDLYNNVCEYFNIKRENLIILEDSLNGLNAAKSAFIEKRIYIPDLVILSKEQEDDLAYMKFKTLSDVKIFLKKNNNII